jgi:ribosome-binding protein aMBF1 (putative translation factor)
MSGKHIQKKTNWTAADHERRRKARELFKDKPTIEQLVASGELSGNTVPMGLYVEIRQLLHDLKKARASAGLSLADLAQRTGMDKAVLSRLENGQHGVPTLPSLARYAQALGMHLSLKLTPGRDAGTTADPDLDGRGEQAAVRMPVQTEPNSSR